MKKAFEFSFKGFSKTKSGWQDSNLRPPHPKCGAIPGYATPRNFLNQMEHLPFAESGGFKPSL